VSILILGDLGAGDSRAAVGWQRQLARLQQHASPMLNLSPTFSSPDGKLFCGSFRPNPFNDYFHLPRHPGSTGFAMSEPSQEVIDNILTWLAPLPLVDAGLLRRLRVEMQWGNSALEAVIWNHSSVRDIGLGICLHQQVNPTAAQTKQRWQIVQTGAQVQIKCEPQSEEADVLRPVAEFDVSQGFPPRLTLTASAEQATWMLHNGLTVALPENGTAII